MWRIGLALYAKAGGVPWKLSDTDPETAYIGVSYAVRPIESERPRFVTCCSQVFDAEGAGLEFVVPTLTKLSTAREPVPFQDRDVQSNEQVNGSVPASACRQSHAA